MINIDVSFDYPKMPMNFKLNVKPKTKLAIIGQSGAGKSTLLNLIAGFDLPSSGKIYLDKIDHTFSPPAKRPVSILFQENNLFTHLKVKDNIALGLSPKLKLNSSEEDKLFFVSKAVGLENLLNRLPSELSGGQKQRVAIARALLRDKPILLLDEPFSALDARLRQEMLELIINLCDEKEITLLLVTHQPEELKGKISNTITIKDGHII